MHKYSKKANNVKRILCLLLAVGMVLSIFASAFLMYF
jgi:uncharacterized membrane protein